MLLCRLRCNAFGSILLQPPVAARANFSSYIHMAQHQLRRCCGSDVQSGQYLQMHRSPKLESVSPSTPSLRLPDWCRLHSSCMRTLAHQHVSNTHIYTHICMYIGASQSLLQCLLLQPACDFFSQLLAVLCVPVSKKAHNAWYTHTHMTSSRSTEATRT